VLAIGTVIAWFIFEFRFAFAVPPLLAEGFFALWFSRRVQQILAPVERRSADLAFFAGILSRLEQQPFAAPRLRRLQEMLFTEGTAASSRIAKLARLLDWLDAKHNILFAFIAPFLLWNTQFAFALEAWRARSGPAIGRWLAAIGDFEALSALAGFAYENPDAPFPEISTTAPCFDAEALGHPLIPRARCVANDVRLCDQLRIWFVSGSNMSGKSTLLRTVGINAVLALAGAPVRARRLRISPLLIGATLRIQDSLQAGKSRFYAEITRVRQLIDLAKQKPPLLFLLDELLQGTNSYDRRIGAEAIVRTLVRYDAIGLLTTHDLALTEIGARLAPVAANVHFEDQLSDGKIAFDYRIHSGVVQHSNALALMRAVGIEV
jgi:DNA mismatch repair ATPase MutS